MKNFLIAATAIVASVTMVHPVQAKEVYASGYVPQYSQPDLYTCGQTVIQMWTRYLTGYTPSVGAIRRMYDSSNGTDRHELEKTLERLTGKGFDDKVETGEYAVRKRIFKELRDQHRPLAYAGTTVRNSGTRYSPHAHWRLIWGADIGTKKSRYRLRWVKVRDPLWGRRDAGLPGDKSKRYEVFHPNHRMSDDYLFNVSWKTRWKWCSTDNQRIMVED